MPRPTPVEKDSLEKKFKELESGRQPDKKEIDTGLGKKGFYSEKEEGAELGKTGMYKKPGLEMQALQENPVIVIILLLAIAGIGYFVFFFQPLVSTGKFEVSVFSGEAKLPNVEVTVYEGANAIATTVTDSNGKAVFENLPAKLLKFAVSSPTGIVEKNINPTGRKYYNINLQSTGVETDAVTLTVLDSETQAPINEVKIAYSLGSGIEKQFIETNENGKASIALQGETILRIRLVDPLERYESQSVTILTTKELLPILLKRATAPLVVLEGKNPFEQTATVTILARDEEGNAIANGEATAFYSFTGAEAGNEEVQNGEAQISGITVDSLVSFTIHAPGFYPSQSQDVLVTASPQPVLVNMEKVPPEAPKTRVIASGGQEGMAYIFQSGNLTQLASNVLTNGESEFTLSDGNYYAVVKVNGFIAATSREFTNGEQVNIELTPASGESAGELEVNVVDEDSNAVIGASVAVLNQDGFLMELPLASEFGSSVKFQLPLNAKITVRVSLEPSESSQDVELVQDTSISIPLVVHAAFLDLKVKNLVDNALVDVTLTSFYNGKTYQMCKGDGGCVVPVRGEKDVAVDVNAAGFLPFTYYAESISEFATKKDEVRIIPADLASGTKAEFIEVVDEVGNPVTGNVLRHGKYVAKFSIYSNSVGQLSLYTRVNDGKQNASLSTIHFLEPLSVDDVDVAKSISYLGPKPQCIDLQNPVFEPPYKWVELTFYKTASQEVNIPFEIPTSILEGAKFSIEFRAKAIAGQAYTRFPKDNVLGFSPASSQKANCYADTVKQEFEVTSAKAPIIETVFPEIKGEFTAGDALVFDPVSKTVKSQGNLQEYNFQIDSILPGDAMPLELQSDNQCTVIVKQPNSTSNAPSSSCYYYDTVKKMLVFASKELNPGCPIHLKQDKFYSASGARVNSDEAAITILATCSPEVKLEIPIKVKFVSDVNSLAVKPEVDQLGEGDAAKLLYIINNRQLQRRTVETLAEKTISFQLNGVGAKPLAWRAPGTLEISEEGDLLEEIIFDQPTPFKSGVGVLSHRQTSCSAENDVYCCANGWCTRKAVEEFIPSFREAAVKLAKGTAFRRANGQPLAYFSSEPFKFTTVVQAAQGAQEALQVEGVSFSSPLTCIPGNPGIYGLTALSYTGNEDEWNYTANALELKKENYLQGASNCGGGSNATQLSSTSASGETTLCNFLSSKNNCIESTQNASINSIDQVEQLEFELVNCMYPVFPSAPVCPGTKMVLPAINIGGLKTKVNFDPTDSPNAFEKIWTSVSDSNASSFSIFSWQGQLKCVVPPSIQQFGIMAATSGIDKIDYAEQEKKQKVPPTLTSDVCSRQDFFNLGAVPNLDTLIPLAGVCCPASVSAQTCTPRRGKFFISSRGNVVKIVTQWGLTESCYPYWPFPTTLRGLLQKQNVVSVTFGLAEFLSSNGANFEMSLASETPGEKPVASTGLSSKQCSSNENCANYAQCTVNTIYKFAGGKCVGNSQSAPGVCSYSSVSQKETCTGGTQCKQVDDNDAQCQECGSEGQPCCIQSDGANAFCKAGFGCVVAGSSHSCTSDCGKKTRPVCGGWQSTPHCSEGSIKPPSSTGLAYSTCQ